MPGSSYSGPFPPFRRALARGSRVPRSAGPSSRSRPAINRGLSTAGTSREGSSSTRLRAKSESPSDRPRPRGTSAFALPLTLRRRWRRGRPLGRRALPRRRAGEPRGALLCMVKQKTRSSSSSARRTGSLLAASTARCQVDRSRSSMANRKGCRSAGGTSGRSRDDAFGVA